MRLLTRFNGITPDVRIAALQIKYDEEKCAPDFYRSVMRLIVGQDQSCEQRLQAFMHYCNIMSGTYQIIVPIP